MITSINNHMIFSIKPCPFCGQPALPLARATRITKESPPAYLAEVAIICTKCGGQSPTSPDFLNALAFWNTRSPDQSDKFLVCARCGKLPEDCVCHPQQDVEPDDEDVEMSQEYYELLAKIEEINRAIQVGLWKIGWKEAQQKAQAPAPDQPPPLVEYKPKCPDCGTELTPNPNALVAPVLRWACPDCKRLVSDHWLASEECHNCGGLITSYGMCECENKVHP